MEKKRRHRRPIADALALKRKSLMLSRGVTPTFLADRWGTSKPFASDLVNGHARALDRERDLAELLGVRHEDIFPPPTERQRARSAAELSGAH